MCRCTSSPLCNTLQLICSAGPGGWRSNCRGVGRRTTPVLRGISGKGALVNDKSPIILISSFIHTQISHTEPDNKNDNSSQCRAQRCAASLSESLDRSLDGWMAGGWFLPASAVRRLMRLFSPFGGATGT